MQLIEDPRFKEFKEKVGSAAQEFFQTMKTEIQTKRFNNKNNQIKRHYLLIFFSQKQKVDEHENQIQKEEILQEIKEQKEPVDDEIDQKAKQLAQIFDCSEQLAKGYVELFKGLSLKEIVDIIYNQK
ncbi:unnamed protein product [Paramecium sonneborni]|uniref:Uncharacterized protein n=1 Tax=Paramecium sonneborni TaxID=65129 RepID=A0A8S1QJ67_9CILI|nr:unnamed protein product [Paramecium sonneborni]